MICSRCGNPASEEVHRVTSKEKCVECCIKGYKFVISQMHREIEKLNSELLKKGKK